MLPIDEDASDGRELDEPAPRRDPQRTPDSEPRKEAVPTADAAPAPLSAPDPHAAIDLSLELVARAEAPN